MKIHSEDLCEIIFQHHCRSNIHVKVIRRIIVIIVQLITNKYSVYETIWTDNWRKTGSV